MVKDISTAKIIRFSTGSTKLHILKICVFVLPVNILTGVECQLLGPHDNILYIEKADYGIWMILLYGLYLLLRGGCTVV